MRLESTTYKKKKKKIVCDTRKSHISGSLNYIDEQMNEKKNSLYDKNGGCILVSLIEDAEVLPVLRTSRS